MEFYCDFFRNFLEFYEVCIEKKLFYSFDILNDNQNHIRIIPKEYYIIIRDMIRNIDLLYIRFPYAYCDGIFLLEDLKERIKEYKEDSTSCVLIYGRNLFPDCFSDFSEQEKQKILSDMIACLDRVTNFVD